MSDPLAFHCPCCSQIVGRPPASPAEQKVIEAALSWDVLFKARSETIPEDDDLHFAVQLLLAVRNEVGSH